MKEQLRPRGVIFFSKVTQHTESQDWGSLAPMHILKDS